MKIKRVLEREREGKGNKESTTWPDIVYIYYFYCYKMQKN